VFPNRRVITRWLSAALFSTFLIAAPFTHSQAIAAVGDTDTSVSFNGSSQYASVSGAGSQIIPTSNSAGSFFTVEMWIYPRTPTANSTNAVLLSQGTGASRFYMKRTSGNLVFYREGQSSESTCGILPESMWTHIAIIVGTSNSYCYLNGALDGTFSYASTTAIGTTFVLSQYSYNIGSGTEYFNGIMDEVKVWNTDRRSNVLSDMNSYNPGDSGLTGYFDFNEGSGSTLTNRVTGASASSNLTLVGSPAFSNVESSTVINGDQVITFPRSYLNANGGWRIPSYVSSVKSLVVGGGGAGGSRAGAGGGAGGYVYDAALAVTPNSVQSIMVGMGGKGFLSAKGNNGTNSQLGSLRIALGGGAGGTDNGADNVPHTGSSGGSGGGSAGGFSSAVLNGAISTQSSTYGYGLGSAGGSGEGTGNWSGGGGGGANISTGAGGNGTATSVGGKGGDGITDPIGGTNICYATGGGGGSANTTGAGGNCGGVASVNNNAGGPVNSTTWPGIATANTGSGGGGGSWNGSSDPIGGFGASGVVILRYALNMSVTLSYSGGTSATYRTVGTITATGSLAGKVTFYERGKAIPGCVRVSMNGSNVATCLWKPSLHGSTTVTATAKPSNTYVPNGSTSLNLAVTARSGKR